MSKIKNKILSFLVLSIVCLVAFLFYSTKVSGSFSFSASECLSKDLNDLNQGERDWCYNTGIPQLLGPIQAANEKNRQDLNALQRQLQNISDRINSFLDQLKKTEEDINQREESMAYTQKIFEEKTVNNYRFLRTYDFITPFLAVDASTAFSQIIFQLRVANADRQSIESYAQELTKLKDDKATLEKNKADLAVVQKQVADKTNFLASEVAKADVYVAALNTRQQAFQAAKLESLGISRSAYNLHGGCSSDINPFKSPGFSPAFAFFSFGVPNRVGMNQYGAWGRAKAGQTYDQILHAYYNFDGYQDFSGVTISVNNSDGIGQGGVIWSGSLEDYVKRIYEVPDNWTDNDSAALKAQAIAARSYALAATNNGTSSICANEHCQVFKTDPKGGNWESVVNATSGKVMVLGGSPIKAWFSAVHGGYEFNSGDIGWSSTSWTKRMVDTPSGNAGSFSDLLNNAYDRDAQWFYCDWGGRADYNKTAWIKPEELADVVNVTLLAEKDGSTKEFLYQMDIDKTYQQRYQIPDPWDPERVENELSNRGITPFNTVSDVSIGADFGTGRTTSVTINGDVGNQTINGDDFKNYFNQRAPSNIQIVGPLYNIEKR